MYFNVFLAKVLKLIKILYDLDILVNVSSTGHQLLEIHSHKIAVKKGDMFAYMSSASYTNLMYTSSSSSSYVYDRGGNDVFPGDVFDLNSHASILNQVPLMKVYLAKAVVFQLPTVSPTDIGEIELQAHISNHLGFPLVVDQTVPVQVCIFVVADQVKIF